MKSALFALIVSIFSFTTLSYIGGGGYYGHLEIDPDTGKVISTHETNTGPFGCMLQGGRSVLLADKMRVTYKTIRSNGSDGVKLEDLPADVWTSITLFNSQETQKEKRFVKLYFSGKLKNLNGGFLYGLESSKGHKLTIYPDKSALLEFPSGQVSVCQ